jgi:hypothetical protein
MSALVLDAGALIAIDAEPITREGGLRAGELLGKTRMKDAIDASVALLGKPGDRCSPAIQATRGRCARGRGTRSW